MIGNYRTSREVAQLLGIKLNSLTAICSRHPQIRPGKRLPSGDLMWTETDVERLRRLRSGFKRSRGETNTLEKAGSR